MNGTISIRWPMIGLLIAVGVAVGFIEPSAGLAYLIGVATATWVILHAMAKGSR